ncbi:MAG: hypothetical protein WHS38_00930 [Thermodesulforhabdaceae bacterium]
MIAGIVGILVAFLVFLLVILFWKRKPNPTIAIPLSNFLTSQGFTPVDSSDPVIKSIRDAYSLTTYGIFIEQVYRRVGDDLTVCWLTDSHGTTNHLVAAIPKMDKNGTWVMLHLPGIKGMSGNFIRKLFGFSLSSSNLEKVESGISGKSATNCELYVKSGDPMPFFRDEFINLLPQCGNIILRSTESITLVERLSIHVTETWEQEAGELLRTANLLKTWL